MNHHVAVYKHLLLCFYLVTALIRLKFKKILMAVERRTRTIRLKGKKAFKTNKFIKTRLTLKQQ